MNYTLGDLGKKEAIKDKIIKNSINDIIEKENDIINQYLLLKNLKKKYPDDINSDFEKHLEKKKLFIEFKLLSKEDQLNALFKLLEYINTLNCKDKKIQAQTILDKINIIEIDLLTFKKIL